MKQSSFVAAVRSQIAARLAAERLLVPTQRGSILRLPLIYPSPYHVGMSSLGYQVVYRLLNDPSRPEVSAERAFLPEDVESWKRARLPLLTYESQARIEESPVILFSVAYELELTGLFSCLEIAGIPVLRSERDTRHPLVICGGPLTFSNPTPLYAFADVVVMGESEDVLPAVVDTLLTAGVGSITPSENDRSALLLRLSELPGVWVPAFHGERLPKVAAADDAKLPATSSILTPHTELSSMFLIEPERGCSRGCTYCVMRRSTNGGMRLVSPERVKSLLPPDITRVGLVGAAVTDHPKLPEILDHVVNERGLSVGISSLRADRLTDDIVGLLAKGGYRTLTVASDGSSERMRDKIERRTKARHIMRSAELAKQHGMKTLKVYMMVGLPDETDEDIDELVGFAKEISKVIRLAYGIAPFVAKRNTPLDGAPFAGIPEVERRLQRLKQGLKGCAEVRPTSARWAWVEYLLAQGGADAGLRAYAAHLAGGSFAAWRRAFDGFATYHAPTVDRFQNLSADQRLRLPLLPPA
ncbi:MAG: radical SAM protein [Polyangia bacterium]